MNTKGDITNHNIIPTPSYNCVQTLTIRISRHIERFIGTDLSQLYPLIAQWDTGIHAHFSMRKIRMLCPHNYTSPIQ